MTVWSLQARLSRHLLLWSALSVLGGSVLLLGGFAPLWRGVGLQGVVWGLVDAGIALFGRWQMGRKRARLEDPDAAAVITREARRLRHLLLINAGLDVLYISAGAAVVLTLGTNNDFARGNGLGIILQGAFLLLFDLFYAQRTGRILAHGPPQTS